MTADQHYELYIGATPDRVWSALTRPEETARYFHGARIEVTADGYLSRGPDGSVWGDAGVDVFDPPRRLVHGWRSLYDAELGAEAESRVTWELEDDGDGVTHLLVTHDRLEGAPLTAARIGGAGWSFVLSNLKTWLETGSPLR